MYYNFVYDFFAPNIPTYIRDLLKMFFIAFKFIIIIKYINIQLISLMNIYLLNFIDCKLISFKLHLIGCPVICSQNYF